MRPKIRVLFWCEDELQASLVRYVVETRLDRILLVQAFTPEGAVKILWASECWTVRDDGRDGYVENGMRCAVLMRTGPGDRCTDVIDALRSCSTNPALPIAVWDPHKTFPSSHAAHLVVTDPATVSLLEMVRIASARKRGPRKKSPAIESIDEWSKEIEACA